MKCAECENNAEYGYFDNVYCEECLESYFIENRMYENYSFDIFLMTDCEKVVLPDVQINKEEYQ